MNQMFALLNKTHIIRLPCFIAVVSLAGLWSHQLCAQETLIPTNVRVIGWNNLIPDNSYPDPFKELSSKQLADLGFVVRVRSLIAAEKIKENGEDARDATSRARKLEKAGVDIEYLLSQRRHIQRIREIQSNAVNESLADKTVALKGFVHPLEISDNQVSTFVLVPYFAACSHGNPPPPNQIIHVKPKVPFNFGGRNMVVEITGRLQALELKHMRGSKLGIQSLKSAYGMTSADVLVKSPVKQELLRR